MLSIQQIFGNSFQYLLDVCLQAETVTQTHTTDTDTDTTADMKLTDTVAARKRQR